MAKFSTIYASIFSVACIFDAGAQGVDAIVKCANTPQDLPQAVIASSGAAASEASLAIQFNIHHPPVGATVFVDDNNHGSCSIEIRNGKKIIGDPHWSFVSESPKSAFSKIGVSATKGTKNGNEAAFYDITAGTAAKGSTVTMKLYVEFQ